MSFSHCFSTYSSCFTAVTVLVWGALTVSVSWAFHEGHRKKGIWDM